MDDSPSTGRASNGPYRHAAPQYFQFGWQPIPLRGKVLAPTWHKGRFLSVTGRGGEWLDAETLRDLIAKYPDHNIGIRLPDGVIGIDVDAYTKGVVKSGGKKAKKGKQSKKVDKQASKQGVASRGDETLRDLETRLGPLPPAPASSARGRPGRYGSGIRLYRVPKGLEFPGKLGPGIETIQWWHRYVAVAPSIHPLTRTPYRWYDPNEEGEPVGDEVYLPSLDEIPKLPKAWLEHLSTKYKAPSRSSGGYVRDADVEKWIIKLDRLNQPEGVADEGLPAMCAAMKKTGMEGAAFMAERGADGAHDEMRDRQWMLLRDALSGHRGLAASLVMLRSAFLGEVEERRDGGRDAASGEWARSLRGAVSKLIDGGLDRKDLSNVVKASSEGDICAVFDENGIAGDKAALANSASGSHAFDFERNDVGNSQRLTRSLSGRSVYVQEWGEWVFYDELTSLWKLDKEHARVTREMVRTVAEMNSEAAYIEDTDQRKAFRNWVKASGSRDKIKAAIYLAEKSTAVIASPAQFDANARALVVRLPGDPERYSVLSLDHSGIAERSLRFEDKAIAHTRAEWRGIEYKSKEWDSFLKDCQPEKKDREFLQALVGSSLLDGNPMRAFIMLHGETTSGKTTFLNAIAQALGGNYARTYDLSMFREKYTHGARPDIVSVMDTRFIYATEASSEWKLHANVIKRLAGGDPIKARNLWSNEMIERQPAFSPWLATNAIPQIQGADIALWRRLVVVPFDVSRAPDQVDTDLGRRLNSPENLSAILAWAVRGWLIACQPNGLFANGILAGSSVATLRRTAEARDLMSDLDAFLAWGCDKDPAVRTLTRELYDAYRTWAALYGDEARAMGINAFGQLLTGKGYPNVRDRDDEGHQGRYRIGLKVRMP